MPENLYTPNCIRTYTGEYIDPLNPEPHKIRIEDIAHALTLQPRFAGHTRVHYSVAEHSIWVADRVPDELRLQALLHDASEAYLSDIATPIKNRLPGYKEAEETLMYAIAERFGFSWPMDPRVKEADREALEWEWENCMLATDFGNGSFRSPRMIQNTFLQYYKTFSRWQQR